MYIYLRLYSFEMKKKKTILFSCFYKDTLEEAVPVLLECDSKYLITNSALSMSSSE